MLEEMTNNSSKDDEESRAIYENTLDGLRQVMAIKARAVLPYLVPQLIAKPVNMRALASLAPVSGEIKSVANIFQIYHICLIIFKNNATFLHVSTKNSFKKAISTEMQGNTTFFRFLRPRPNGSKIGNLGPKYIFYQFFIGLLK